MTKKCKTCARYIELRIIGSDTWHPYCHQDDVYEPCTGEKCQYPHYYKQLKNKQ